ncbi:MAG: glycosyltransferase [Clostridiales bacterium]|jgi:processive 1,2-diacylglycerol beta-glucosyltransferase|nr:glycosyltransferase [Clostridiales bacterium]
MNILFVTSFSTGQGHKSITEALKAQIERQMPEARITVVDGFAIGNWAARASGRVYNAIAVYMPLLWGMLYRFCDFAHNSINRLTAYCIKDGFINCVNFHDPDLIISVHAAFVGSILSILSEKSKSIPVISVIADLDNITSLWSDKRVHSIVCPTEEACKRMRELGMPDEKLKHFGFPVRDEFISNEEPPAPEAGKRISALLISGSQGSRKIKSIVKSLSADGSCKMCIITGSNALLKAELEKVQNDFIDVLGFTSEIVKYMKQADLLIARASPNVLMEAVNLGKPVIVTDSFYGQEKKNPKFMTSHRLGIFCGKPRKIVKAIDMLKADNFKLLKEISKNQMDYRKPDAAERIAAFAIESCAVSEMKKVEM